MKNVFSILSLVAILFFSFNKNYAQDIPESRLVNWEHAGLESIDLNSGSTLNVLDHGLTGDGVTSNDEAILELLNNASTPVSELFFPEGTYLFNTPLSLQNDAILRGASAEHTKFVFNNNGSDHLIKILGNRSNTESTIIQDALIGQDTIWLSESSLFTVGDYIMITEDDAHLVTSSWALNSTGQINKIVDINDEQIILKSKLRRSFSIENIAHVYKINPVKNVKIENISIERLDSTDTQTSNIYLDYAANCQIKCIESYNCNFAHVDIRNSINIEIEGSYFHEAFDYGGGGKAYGVMLHFSTGESLIQNSIFRKLRHSMIVQAGANGNVFAYNYSTQPYWTETSLPENAAGDLVLHGNYPYANLFEGNIVQQIVIDDSHGKNGPLNTFFRNRVENYGIFMNFSPPSDAQNFIGNEITNTNIGSYFLFGSDHFQLANNVKSTIIPEGSSELEPSSLFLNTNPAFFTPIDTWPPIGDPAFYNTWSIPAKTYFEMDIFTACQEIPNHVADLENKEIEIWPNPTNASFSISLPEQESVVNIQVFSVDGKQIKVFGKRDDLNITELQDGLYFLKVNTTSGEYFTKTLLKQ